MSDGILYTEHSALTGPHLPSLWSFESCRRDASRSRVVCNRNGSQEYWLERSDPLLNTMLPGTGVTLVVNLGDLWAAGRSLAASAFLPRVCLVGPVTQARILRLGKDVLAVGAGIPSALTLAIFGLPAAELVDRIVPLDEVWKETAADRLLTKVSGLPVAQSMSVLKDEMMERIRRRPTVETAAYRAAQEILSHGGRVSITDLARQHGVSRRQFAREFSSTAGLAPKLFARITRFQSLLQALLSADVSEWASVSSEVGFYDQAHMINEFHAFAGSAPTAFFRLLGEESDAANARPQGRPSEWSAR